MCFCTWSIFLAKVRCTWQYKLQLNPKMHCCIAHFRLQNHTWCSWGVLLNGKKYGNGGNETFCEGCKEEFWDQVFKVAYTRYIERQSKSMKFGGSQVWIICTIDGKIAQLLKKGNFEIKMAIDQSFFKLLQTNHSRFNMFFRSFSNNNDINVLDRSPRITNLLQRPTQNMDFVINGNTYPKYYLLVDGIFSMERFCLNNSWTTRKEKVTFF
jgi:hypothetical protein